MTRPHLIKYPKLLLLIYMAIAVTRTNARFSQGKETDVAYVPQNYIYRKGKGYTTRSPTRSPSRSPSLSPSSSPSSSSRPSSSPSSSPSLSPSVSTVQAPVIRPPTNASPVTSPTPPTITDSVGTPLGDTGEI